MRHARLPAALLAAVLAAPLAAAPPVPYSEIVDMVREVAADLMGRKPSEIDTVQSLTAQGMNEKQLDALVITLQQEFNLVIPDDELRHAKLNDPAVPLSVRRLSDMVAKRMRSPPPW